MLVKTAVAALLSLAAHVSAHKLASQNWGCSSLLKHSASDHDKSSCSGSGSFFFEFNGKAICASVETRTKPDSGITCPLGWSMQKEAGCCVPEKEVSDCDCGEGFGWNSGGKKCKSNGGGGKCKSHQWWHDRTDECCDDSWESHPPSGECDKGKSCPTGWFWHKSLKICLPRHKRSPAPDCDDWDEKNHCCGGHGPQPSQGTGHGGGHSGGGHSDGGHHGKHNGWKRDFLGRQQNVIVGQDIFPQSDFDKMYCPKGLHACSIVTPAGGEWAYECIDIATELESCGGCVSTGHGQDCSAIPHALAVGCERGACAVYSCQNGFAANGTDCVVV